ncbi:RNA polymerase sigma factor [Pseudomonadota bacterium]
MTDVSSESIEELLHSGYRYALSLTNDKSRAEDILQDAWLAVLKAKGPRKRPYLYSAVRSRFLNMYKREQLVSVVSLDDAPEIEDKIADDGLSSSIDYALLESALDDLRSIEREALYLMVVEGYTAKEIAEFTQQPRGTVLSLVHRAKQKVRCYVELKQSEVSP